MPTSLYKYLLAGYIILSGIILIIYPRDEVIRSDAEGYYMYLPAFFIYDGFESIPTDPRRSYGPNDETGKYFSHYTYGVAIFQAPFFIVGHFALNVLSKLDSSSDYSTADGYSHPYHQLIFLSALFYGALGLMFLKKTLNHFFDHKVSILGLVGTVLGTNLLYYTIFDPGYSHIYSFFLISALLYYLIKWEKNQSALNMLRVSFLVVLIIFVRPSNVFIIFYVLGFGLIVKKDISRRLNVILAQYKVVVGALILLGILVVIQLLLWKEMNDGWIFYSYGSERTFTNWANPKFFQVLFDVQNGLFIYSPILLFGAVGIALNFKNNRFNSTGLLLFLVIMTYVFGSYFNWWFGGAFGHRCYVEFFPLLALPMCDVFKRVLGNGSAIRGLFYSIYGLTIYYSIGLTFNYVHPWEGPGWTWGKLGEVILRIFFLG
ncbi:MAG: hypothetical protein RJQ09_18805 [Cyclobacteriaceae bacterium]